MRNLILSAIVLFGMTTLVFGQNGHMEKDYLLLTTINNEGHVVENKKYEGEAASQIDVKEFIVSNLDSEKKVIVRGRFVTDLEIKRIDFNSDELKIDGIQEVLCEQKESSLIPVIGIEAKSTDDLNGVGIERIIDNSSAMKIEMTNEDVILSFNGADIISPCELQIEVRAKIYNVLSYQYCAQPIEKSGIASRLMSSRDFGLNAYPNPTNGTSVILFNSNSDSPVSLTISDVLGKTIHTEKRTETGIRNHQFEYDFSGMQNGTYLVVIHQEDQVYVTKLIYSRR